MPDEISNQKLARQLDEEAKTYAKQAIDRLSTRQGTTLAVLALERRLAHVSVMLADVLSEQVDRLMSRLESW